MTNIFGLHYYLLRPLVRPLNSCLSEVGGGGGGELKTRKLYDMHLFHKRKKKLEVKNF